MKLNKTFLTIAAFAFCIAASNTTKAQTENKQRLDSIVAPNNNKTIYTYDSRGNDRQRATYTWDAGNNAWRGSSKEEYTYDANGNQTLIISYSWDAGNNTWKGNQKSEYTYDANGNLALQIRYSWDAGNTTWIESNKSEYTYDANGNLTSWIYYSWNTGNTAWRENQKQESTYDANGNRTLHIAYTWDAGNNTWRENYKHEYTYDANGNQTLDIYYTWDAGNNTWRESQKVEYTYDANDNQTLQISYSWDAGNNTWRENRKEESTYDLSISKEDLLQPYNFAYNNKILEWKDYTWSGTDWVYSSTYTFYWSEHSVGIAEMQNLSSVQVYPNPAQNTLYIESSEAMEQVRVYDISGRELIQLPYPAQSIDISTLANGIYIIKVKTAAGETVKKIVKQ